MTHDEEDVKCQSFIRAYHSRWDCKYHVIFVPKDLVTLCFTSLTL
jgi:hypothetical protein